MLTLRFDPRLEAFDDQPLREFLAAREVLAVREHFFVCHHVPYLAVVVTYALEPRTPAGAPGDAAHGQRGPDWRSQVPEADLPLFDALRDWRADRARRDGVPPYMIFTNRQLVAILEARPRSLTRLGLIEGVGKAKLEKYGQELLALLPAPRGEPATPSRTPTADGPPPSAPAEPPRSAPEGGAEDA